MKTHVHTHNGNPLSVVLLEDLARETRYTLADIASAARNVGCTVYQVPRRSIGHGSEGYTPAVIPGIARSVLRSAARSTHRPRW